MAEPVVPTEPKTNETLAAQPTPAPQANTAPAASADNTDSEELKRELEKARMRANQLENEAKARAEAEAAAEAKRLEEQGEWQKVAEQEKAKREEIEREREQLTRDSALRDAKASTESGYSDDVKKSAEDLGITLTGSTEEEIAAYKAKLDKLAERSGNTNPVTPNNPNPAAPSSDRNALLQEHLKNRGGSSKFVTEAISGLSGIDKMKETAGWEQ